MIETEIQKYEIFMQSLFDDGSLRKMDINCKIEDKITGVLSTVNSLGSISIESSSPLVVMQKGNEIQAQTRSLQHVPPSTINDITMTLQNDGTCIDDKTVAVSFTNQTQIQIIKVSTKTVECTIKTAGSCYGLCYTDGYLLYCDCGRGIQKVNMSDYCSSTLVKDNTLSQWSYIATSKDKIVYTNNSHHTVTCCSLAGEKMWEYKDQSVRFPLGISVDKDSNVYIASSGNDSIIALSSDGKEARKLLGSDDGIRPYGLAFDVKKEKIIVAYYDGPALYGLKF
ncbi:unnamed protein product [Mytilus coruscus]|uniref:TRIM2_3 n=1 Tax=Mytilus coruscus TaxID=42192 RepID=A0A6J8C2H4_MYTCO|nr:unnamed protein product [Mytilus coruscus]